MKNIRLGFGGGILKDFVFEINQPGLFMDVINFEVGCIYITSTNCAVIAGMVFYFRFNETGFSVHKAIINCWPSKIRQFFKCCSNIED